jgi:hypothetical protein
LSLKGRIISLAQSKAAIITSSEFTVFTVGIKIARSTDDYKMMVPSAAIHEVSQESFLHGEGGYIQGTVIGYRGLLGG